MHALNDGGDLRWIVRLTDESYPDILEHPDGRFGERRGEHTDTYRTYLIEAEAGRGVGAFQADHQVIGGGGDRAVLYRENPFPRVAAVEIR